MSNEPNQKLRFNCPKCNCELVFPASAGGSRIQCTSCKAKVLVRDTKQEEEISLDELLNLGDGWSQPSHPSSESRATESTSPQVPPFARDGDLDDTISLTRDDYIVEDLQTPESDDDQVLELPTDDTESQPLRFNRQPQTDFGEELQMDVDGNQSTDRIEADGDPQSEKHPATEEQVELLDDDEIDDLLDITTTQPSEVRSEGSKSSSTLGNLATSNPFEHDEFAPIAIDGITIPENSAVMTCPICRTRIDAKPSEIGTRKRCPDCYSMVEIKGDKRLPSDENNAAQARRNDSTLWGAPSQLVNNASSEDVSPGDVQSLDLELSGQFENSLEPFGEVDPIEKPLLFSDEISLDVTGQAMPGFGSTIESTAGLDALQERSSFDSSSTSQRLDDDVPIYVAPEDFPDPDDDPKPNKHDDSDRSTRRSAAASDTAINVEPNDIQWIHPASPEAPKSFDTVDVTQSSTVDETKPGMQSHRQPISERAAEDDDTELALEAPAPRFKTSSEDILITDDAELLGSEGRGNPRGTTSPYRPSPTVNEPRFGEPRSAATSLSASPIESTGQKPGSVSENSEERPAQRNRSNGLPDNADGDHGSGDLPNLSHDFPKWVRSLFTDFTDLRVVGRMATLAFILGIAYILADWRHYFPAGEDKSFFNLMGAAFSITALGVVFATWLVSTTIHAAAAINYEIDATPRVNRWNSWIPDAAWEKFFGVAPVAWLSMFPGQLIGTVFFASTGAIIGFYLSTLISGFALTPLLLLSTIYNGNPLFMVAPKVFSTVFTVPNRWIRFYLASFPLLLAMMILGFALYVNHLIFTLIVAGLVMVVLTIYIKLLGSHFHDLLSFIDRDGEGRKV